MIFLAALIALFIWLGRRRGMAYWGWATGYLALVLINLLAAYVIKVDGLTLVTSSLCLVYILIFLLWPWLADKNQVKDMEEIKKEYVREDELTDQRIQEKFKDWFVIKTYDDKQDSVQFQKDRTTLETNAIVPQAKSCFGLTTISVEEKNIEKACKLLGIDSLPNDTEANDEKEL